MNLFKIVILMTNLRFSRVSTKLIKILKIQMIKNSKLLLENQKLSGIDILDNSIFNCKFI